MRPGAFEFDSTRENDVLHARIAGDLDMAATFKLEPELERLTSQEGIGALVIDLAGVEFIDSSGLGLLLATYDRLRTSSIRFELANPSQSVRRMLDLTGATRELPVTAAP